MEKIKKILLIAVLVGILILLFISQHLEPPLQSIRSLNESQINQKVKIEGVISKVKDYNNETFHILTLKESNSTIQVIFNSKPQKIESNFSLIYITVGKLEKYNETLQINAEKIFLKNK